MKEPLIQVMGKKLYGVDKHEDGHPFDVYRYNEENGSWEFVVGYENEQKAVKEATIMAMT